MPQMGDPRTYAIIGAAMEVHNQVSSGFLEAVYQELMELELRARGIPFESQVSLTLVYKGQELRSRYRPDLLCHDDILVELKAQKALGDVDAAQILHYLKLTGVSCGLLINFGGPRLQFERFVNGWASAPSASSLLAPAKPRAEGAPSLHW